MYLLMLHMQIILFGVWYVWLMFGIFLNVKYYVSMFRFFADEW